MLVQGGLEPERTHIREETYVKTRLQIVEGPFSPMWTEHAFTMRLNLRISEPLLNVRTPISEGQSLHEPTAVSSHQGRATILVEEINIPFLRMIKGRTTIHLRLTERNPRLRTG